MSYNKTIMHKELNMPKDKQDNTNTPTEAGLYAVLGISSDQVEAKEGTTTTKEILTKADALKVDSKQAIKDMNSKHGKNISFVCLSREGSLKDASGEFVLDENGKKKPRFVMKPMKGNWVIDERDDGYLEVTRCVYYSEHYTISKFTELV